MKNCNEVEQRIKRLREQSIDKILRKSNKQLDRPVSFWIKEDRLLDKKGKEFTIILKTKGCSWALSSSGGCSMCGYLQDSYINDIDDKSIISQFDYAFERKMEEILNSKEKFVIKIFNSGSFLDDREISKAVRNHIFHRITKVSNIEEIVIESRVEYIKERIVKEISQLSGDAYLEVAIGLESSDDYVRNNYVNKGLNYVDFLNAVALLKEKGVGIRVYLLLKPPFLNEEGAIDDCIRSSEELIKLGVNTISINPINIQKDSFVEYLFRQNRYRPPWFYSLFKVLREIAKSHSDLSSIRLISDPSGAGTKRGIHNCLERECNTRMIKLLKNYVLTQDAGILLEKQNYSQCECLTKYRLQKEYSLL